MAESKEELKNFLMRVKEESERASLSLNIKKKKNPKIISCSPITAWQTEGEMVKVATDFLFLGSKIIADSDSHQWNQKTTASWQESDDKPRQRVEKQRHHSADKGPYSQGYGFPSGQVGLWELAIRRQMPKNWCFWTVVLEKAHESLLDSKKIMPVNLKGDQPWISTEGLILKL